MTWEGAEVLRGSLVAIDTLEPFPDNPRLGDTESIAASLKRFGQVKPVVVDGSRIIAGHHLIEAARTLGWDNIAVLDNRFADEDEQRAFLIADNGVAARGSFDTALLVQQLRAVESLEGTGYDDDALKELEKRLRAMQDSSVSDGGDGIPEPPAEPISKRGEVYELGEHRLMCGDATDPDDVAKLLGDEQVQVIFTSPPYGVGLKYSAYEDTLQNLRLLLLALAGIWRDWVPAGGYCVTNFGDNFAAREMLGESEPCEFPMALEYWPVFRDAGWLLHTRRIYQKIPTWARDPWTFESNRAAFDWEHLWTWKRPGKGLSDRREPSFMGVWHYPGSDTTKKETHPAAFPVGLALDVLRVYSNQGDAVADPFAGSGAVLVAAEALKRRAFVMDVSESYCDVMRARWAAVVAAKENLAWSTERAVDHV